jgi:hypothetical protein
MRKITNREIEKMAIMEIINYFEPKIDAVIKQSCVELDKINKKRKAQSIDVKLRIDRFCVQNAIKTINSKKNSQLQNKAGGLIKKRNKFCKKHPQINESLTEAV